MPASVVDEPALHAVATANVPKLGETECQAPFAEKSFASEDCDLLDMHITDDYVSQVVREHEFSNHLKTGNEYDVTDEVMLTEVERKYSHAPAEQNVISDATVTLDEISLLGSSHQHEEFSFVDLENLLECDLGLLECDLGLEGCKKFMCN